MWKEWLRPSSVPVFQDKDEFLEHDHVLLERTVWRKLDIRVLPICAMFHFLSFLDKSNIGNASVAGMKTTLEMSNYQYCVALTLTYVPYVAAELPSNLALRHVGPNLLLPAMATMWGFVCAMQGFVRNYPELLACRFFLGLMEGGLFPGLVLYLSSFYPRERLQMRIAAFFAPVALSVAFSGLLAAAITHLDGKGGKPGWAWIFILEGSFTFLFGTTAFVLLPRSPTKTRFLSQQEQSYIISSLKNRGTISTDEAKDNFSWKQVLRSARSPHVWLVSIASFFNGTILYGMAYFTPTIVESLGYTGNQAQLMSVPPYAAACCFCLVSAVISDKYGCRGLMVILSSMFTTTGFSLFCGSTSHHIRYVSLFFSIVGTYGASPCLVTWSANNSAPHTRRATSIAMNTILANAGGILATWLLGVLSPGPNYREATITFIFMAVGIGVLSALNLLYLRRENRLKAEKRLVATKGDEQDTLGDRSAWFVYNL